jgi:myo-inositol 2-dehydrogenase/D-chiro-inositol 1-dehydrogenase
MLIFDSVVHEIDIVRYLTDSPIKSVEVKHFKRNSNAPEGVNEPILVLLETENGVLANVEMNVNVRFGYQVKTEAVFENGIADIGRIGGMELSFESAISKAEHVTFKTRFAAAYDSQIQRWVNAVALGTIDGPSAWDGYLAAAAVEAGLEALKTGKKVDAKYAPIPKLYSLAS